MFKLEVFDDFFLYMLAIPDEENLKFLVDPDADCR